jgi:methionine--tRNA ligase beta chain
MDETSEPTPLPELDLRVARIAEASSHPDADRLIILEVSLGDERRQIVAGLVGHYDPEELPGRHIVIVANLQPAVLRGAESQGMLLAAEDGTGRLGLLTAPDAEPGQRLAADGSGPPARDVRFADFLKHELRADEDGVTHNGRALRGARLVMDRAVYGKLH